MSNAAVAEQLGLSRAPVRDALARLADEGLVETKPQSYTRVTPLALKEVRDAAEVVARDARAGRAHRHPAADGRAYRGDARGEPPVRGGHRTADVDAALESDDDLHGVLIGVCGNRAVAATIERYTPLIRLLERRQFSSARARRSVQRHDELIAACAAGDVGQAIQVTGQIWQSLEDLADDLSAH